MTVATPSLPPVAARMTDIAPFHVMELYKRARQLEAQGRRVIHMEVGEPDFPTPEPVVAAATEFIRKGDVHYTPAQGIPPLREAIAGFYRDRYGVPVEPERIVVTVGASGALTLLMGVLLNPGDEVLLPDPGYPCNRHFVRSFEGVPRALPVSAASHYQPTPAQVEAAWTPRTRALLVGSPSNPTGTMLDGGEIAALARCAAARGGHFIVDEIYHGLTYGCDARTALEFSDQVFVVNSFSKYFNMTGWRLGWLVAPREYVRDVEKLAGNLFISPPSPAQFGALAAFSPETIEILEGHRREFQARRDFLLPAVERIGFRVQAQPRGAFYLYADSSELAPDSFDLAHDLIEKAGVAVTPGVDFGANAPERHLRFAYTVAAEKLEEGVDRIARFLGR